MADADFSVKAIISAQTSQFEKGIKNAQSSVNSLSSSISNITNLVKKAFAFTGVAIGTKAIVDFGKSCVQSANQAVKTFNILDNTVKATGADAWTSTKELEKASMELSDSTNYSVTEIQKMQSVLLGFTNITGKAFDGASEAVLDMATVMGMDLTSAVQTIGKALDDPITGLDSLRRQGFKFTDEQKAELAQLVKNGKQLEAQNIILDTLATSYGGAAKAGQDSFAKQRHAVENLQDAIGGKLIPVMQVFAENNSKMINSLTDVISKMDFTPVVNVVTNLSKIFAETFNTISGYLRNVGEYVSDFISRFNFKPIISVLDGLLGGLSEIISKFKEINSQKLEIFDKLKEALIDFSNSETFQNIVNFVNKIIDAVFFLWSEVQDIAGEIRNLVVNKIIEIWNKIKELFQNSQNALSESGQEIASWGDLFYNILNNAFRSFQDFFGMIKALIHGDWTVAWEYAKLTVMRIADNILDIFSTIANAFPNLINVFLKGWNWVIEQINKARKLFGQDPLGLAGAFESVDISKKSGLEDEIKKAENKIQELTGKSADITIQNLESVSTKFAGFTQHALGEIGKLTEGVATNSEKQKNYFAGTFSSTEKDGGSTYEKFSEWDSKLLQQRLEDLDEWSDEYHEVQLALIEEERKKALEADKTGAETEKINEYYNKQIEKENERSEKAKRNKVKETMKVVLSTISNIAKKTVEVFKKVVSAISNAFSAIVNLVKNIGNIFSKLFEFNPDEALDALLGFEDTVLTFFVETLPKLPSFVETAFSSLSGFLNSLGASISFDELHTELESIVKSVTTYAPQIVSSVVSIFTGLSATISDVLITKAPEIVNALGSMFFSILEALPNLISNFLKVAGTYLSEIGKYITDNAERLTNDLSGIVKSIVDGISAFLEGDGWQNLLNGILTIQNAIQTAITDNLDSIVDAIIEGLPEFVQFFVDSFVSASKAITKVIKPLIKLVMALIDAIFEILLSDEVMDAGLEVGSALIEGIIGELIPKLIVLIVKNLPKIVRSILLAIPKMVVAMVTGLINAFKNTDWKQVCIDIWTGFVDGIKDFFGIHSPSTLFESFGEFMIQGLWQGINGLATWLNDNVGKFFSNMWDGICNVFSNVGGWFKDTFSGVGDKISEGVGNLGSWASDRWNDIKNGFTGVGEWFKTTFEDASSKTKSAFENIGTWAGDRWNDIKNGFSNVGDWFSSTFSNAWSKAKDGFSKVGEWASGIWSDIKEGFGNVGEWFSTGFSTAWDNVKSAFTNVKDWAGGVWGNIKEGFDGVGDWFSTTFSNAWSNVKSAFAGAKDWFSNLFTDIGKSLSNFVSEASKKLQAVGDKINEKVITPMKNGIENFADGVKNVATKVGEGVKTVATNVGNGIKTAATTVGTGIKNTVSNIGSGIKNLFHFATGTQQAPRGLALVGEAGPELVKFRGGEQVINNKNTQKLLAGNGGNNNNFNVTFNNLQDTTAFAMLQQLKQYNRQMAINGII